MKELAKRVQHLATSKNAATKILPFPKFIKNHATRWNILLQGGQTREIRRTPQCPKARVWEDHVIYFALMVLCYFKKCFLSCGIEPLQEQSLSRWSPILSTNLPARRLSVCLQIRFYWTLLWNGWVITLSYIFHVSFFSVLISPLKTSHMKGWTNQHRFFKIYKPQQNTVDSLFWYLQHSLKYM